MLRQQLRISTALLSDAAKGVASFRSGRESLSKAAFAASDKDEYGPGGALRARAAGGCWRCSADCARGGPVGLLATLSGSPKRAPSRTGSAARGRRSWRLCRGRDSGVSGTQAGQGATAGEPSGRVEATQQVSPQSGQSLGGVLIVRSWDRLRLAGLARFGWSVLAEWAGERQVRRTSTISPSESPGLQGRSRSSLRRRLVRSAPKRTRARSRYRNLRPDLVGPGSPNLASCRPAQLLEEPGSTPAPARSGRIRPI